MVFYVNVAYIFYLIYMYTCLPYRRAVLFWFHWAAQQKLFILVLTLILSPCPNKWDQIIFPGFCVEMF